MDDFEKQIIKELIKSYDDFVWYFKLKIKRPLIELCELKSRWGSWDPLLRVITINKRLVQNYSWNTVLEILKHEMAHQIVCDVYGDLSDNTHGVRFQKACEALRILPWARSATGAIVELSSDPRARFKSQMNVDEQRSLDRIQKLLELSKSSNSFEAELAMRRVKELTILHEREFSAQASNQSKLYSNYDVYTLNLKSQRIQPFESRILSLLGEHFSVKVVLSSTFDPSSMKYVKTAEIMGRTQHLVVVDYVFEFLRRTALSLWQFQRIHGKLDMRLKRSFLIGVIVGVDQKLHEARRDQKNTLNINRDHSPKVITDEKAIFLSTEALTNINKQELADFSSYIFPRMRRSARAETRVNQSAFDAGVSQGKRISIRPGVASGNSGMNFLTK